ncbi:hypothetical protein [Brevibacillus laterosporus]|nr:hypothetical protein [Brevibacillus laterosporus]
MNWYPPKIFIILLFDLLERVINLLSLYYKEGLTLTHYPLHDIG